MKAESSNYRGVHLTGKLSNVVECAVGFLFLPWLEEMGGYGPCKYACRKRRVYRDVLVVNTCTWLRLLEEGFAVDRVACERLTEKLALTGLHADVVDLLARWLSDRTSIVVLAGCASSAVPLTNSVFQGTMLGPPLWITCFADSNRAPTKGFPATTFADDLNAWKAFRFHRTSATALEGLSVSSSLHKPSCISGALLTMSFLIL